MTNDGKHDASPSFNVPISTFFCEDDLRVAFRVKLESAMRTPKTQSIFHLRTRRNAFYRDTRQPTEPEKTFLCMDLSRRTRTQNQ
jgi:hypothetical protein